jgi:hypothetical protein
MATFEAQISTQVSQGQKDAIREVLDADRRNARVSEADVVRAALRLGLPLLAEQDGSVRVRLYALINRGE